MSDSRIADDLAHVSDSLDRAVRLLADIAEGLLPRDEDGQPVHLLDRIADSLDALREAQASAPVPQPLPNPIIGGDGLPTPACPIHPRPMRLTRKGTAFMCPARPDEDSDEDRNPAGFCTQFAAYGPDGSLSRWTYDWGE